MQTCKRCLFAFTQNGIKFEWMEPIEMSSYYYTAKLCSEHSSVCAGFDVLGYMIGISTAMVSSNDVNQETPFLAQTSYHS